MFSAAEREKLEITLAAFEKETSNQLVVVTVPTLDGQPIEDFSIKLAEKWKIGTKEHNNGVILLFSKEDRAMRIEVGYGLEGVLPDALAKRIIENEIVPRFKQGDFDGGVNRGVDSIIQATRGEYKGTHNDNSEAGLDTEDKIAHLIVAVPFLYLVAPMIAYFILVLMMTVYFGSTGFGISVIIAIILFWLRWKYLDKFFSKASTYSGSRGGYHSGFFGGGGGSGGGFGGGGGGSFGGGGASGRW